MNILAVDLGQRRIGLAINYKKSVVGLETLVYTNRDEALRKLAEIIRAEKIETLIIGLPKGNIVSEDQVRSFALELNKIIEIPIKFEDETLTSKEAERILSSSKLNKKTKKYKEEVDKISAKLILEQYLNK